LVARVPVEALARATGEVVASALGAPLFNEPPVLKALKELRSAAFVVGGSSDKAFNLVEAEALRDRGVEVVVLDGANHGLEVDDPVASARLLASVLDEMRGFVLRATRAKTGQANV